MPLEPSVLNEKQLAKLLRNHYKLEPCNVCGIGTGTANCFHVFTETGEFFLKEYQSKFTADELEREAELLVFLKERQFPATDFIKTRDGGYYVRQDNRCFSLQPFVGGVTHENHSLPDNLLIEAAGLLGQMHSLLKGYPLPLDMDEEWVGKFHPEASAFRYDELISALEKETDFSRRARIEKDLIFKRSLQNKIAGYGAYYKHLTYTPTHGDYCSLQFLCGKNGIDTIVDFSSARILPAAWELMRCYTQSAIECKSGSDIDVDKLCRYIDEYLKYSSLNDYDLRYMPHIYLFQLGRSAYGYKEYLIMKSENKEELLRFAFWRTDVCRMMLERADEIGQKISEAF